MTMRSDPICLRVKGPFACFTRPEFYVERRKSEGGAGDPPAPVGDPPSGFPTPARTGRCPSPLWEEGVRRTDEMRRPKFQPAPGEVSDLILDEMRKLTL